MRVIRFLAILFALGTKAFAAGSLPFSPDKFTDLDELLTDDITKTLVKTVGAITLHRPLQPATPLGTMLGLDIGIEASLTRVPDDLNAALQNAGVTSTIPASLPFARLHVHKGLGKLLDFGVSGLKFQDFWVMGGNIKVTLGVPPEGLTWAIRLNYNYSKLGFVKVKSWSPEILVSKRLFFFEPYLGVGYQYHVGSIELSIPTSQLDQIPPEFQGQIPETLTLGNSAKIHGYHSFLGLAFRLLPTGLKITLEGSYSSLTAHTIATKIGFEL